MIELDAYDRAQHALRRPAWWLLYLIGLLLLAFGLMLLWRHCNRARWT